MRFGVFGSLGGGRNQKCVVFGEALSDFMGFPLFSTFFLANAKRQCCQLGILHTPWGSRTEKHQGLVFDVPHLILISNPHPHSGVLKAFLSSDICCATKKQPYKWVTGAITPIQKEL